MITSSVVAISIGSSLGACLRWWLGLRLNPLIPGLPLGTLAANLIGGLLIGVALEYFARDTALSPTVRLAVVTGFLGGLTTFSTFSAETVQLLQRGESLWALATVAAHVFGSLLLTALGILLVRWIQPAWP